MTSPAPRWAIVDGQRVEHDGATVHASDLGLRRGFAVFEMFRVEAGVPLFLEHHLARLARSADASACRSPAASTAWPPTCAPSSTPTRPTSSAVQILLTGGPSSDGVTFRQPTCIVTSMHLPPRSTEPAGASLVTDRHTRELPEAKSTNYLTFMRLAGPCAPPGRSTSSTTTARSWPNAPARPSP
jgi:branched-chain amino acid aminotransferase